MSDDIVVGSVAVDIVPSTTNFRRDLQAKVQGISVDVGVTADTTGIRAKLDELATPRDATINVNADTATATAQIDDAARDRTSTIRANVDGSQVGAIGKLADGLGGISGFAATIITLGPALIPILAAVAGVGLALAAPLAIAGGGATVFGFLAGFAIKDTDRQLKAIDKQRAHLATLTKGTKEYAKAQSDLRGMIAGLSPAQKKFADALDHIKGSFATLLGGGAGAKLLNPVSAFLNTAADALPKLSPIIGAVSDALSSLIGDLGKAVRSPDFQAFVTAFSQQVGPDIVAFGHIAGNVFKGVAGLVVKLGQAFGPGLLKGLESLTGKFAALGDQGAHSQKLRDFVDYFHRIGPSVGDTLQAVARAIGHIVTALAPLGPPVLKVIEGIANSISGIPIPVLTGLAAAFGAMVLASKASKGLSALGLLSGGGGLGKGGGILGQFVSKARPVPVYVVNQVPTTTSPGGPPIVTTAKATAAEVEATKAAKLAADAVKAAGGDAAAQSSAAARAFKEAIAAHDAAAIKEALSFGGTSGIRGILRGIFSAPASVTLGDSGAEVPRNKGGTLAGIPTGASQTQVIKILLERAQTPAQIAGIEQAFGITPEQARSVANLPQLKSTTTHVDALKSSLADASRTIDQIGPHADASFGQASKDVRDFSAKLDGVHDKKVKVLLDDLAAVQSLKALQALRLRDKTLTIQIEQEIDRVVGPGGGIGHPTGSAGGGSVSAAPRTTSGTSGPLVNIENANVADTHDLLRKSQDALIARAGGGVLLRPPPSARF